MLTTYLPCLSLPLSSFYGNPPYVKAATGLRIPFDTVENHVILLDFLIHRTVKQLFSYLSNPCEMSKDEISLNGGRDTSSDA